MTKKFTFPAGKYYIGDPCYVINPHSEWIRLLERTNYLGDGDFTYRKHKCHASGTAYGDGVYADNIGNHYGVDAGLLSIIHIDAIKKPDLKEMKRLGAVIDFEDEFRVYSNNGVFHFGHIQIDTNHDNWSDDE